MSTNLIIFLSLVLIGYIFGRRAEMKHFNSIMERESEYKNLLAFSARFPPADMSISESKLVGGTVVISIDYFKRLAAGLRNIFGGRVTAYESLIERARREAILRMKEEAITMGAQMIINVKLETSSITKGAGDQVGAVEVYAYGTALKN